MPTSIKKYPIRGLLLVCMLFELSIAQAQEQTTAFSTVGGYEASQPYCKLLLHNQRFTLSQSHINKNTRNYITVIGTYVQTASGVELKAEHKSEFGFEGIEETHHIKKELNQTIKVKIDTQLNMQYANFVFLAQENQLSNYIAAPDSLYEILAGNYMIMNDATGYSLELRLSHPKKNDLGDYGHYFYLAEGEDIGDDGNVIREIAGRYIIEVGKLYLLYTLTETVSTDYSNTPNSHVELITHKPQKIDVKYEITNEGVKLDLSCWNKRLEISKPRY